MGISILKYSINHCCFSLVRCRASQIRFRSAIPGVRLTLTLTLTPMPGPGNGGPREWGAGTVKYSNGACHIVVSINMNIVHRRLLTSQLLYRTAPVCLYFLITANINK